MKKAIFVLASLSFVTSCSNELDIAADYKEITIIYGLLNQADGNEHYVQVFRGFLDQNASALLIAQNPDSLYYDDSVEVKLEDGSSTFILEKIIGPNRTPGVFVDSPNYVYRFIGSINEDAAYKIIVTNRRTGHVASAQTPIVKDFNIQRPSTLPLINFASNSDNEIRWVPADNGRVYQCIIRFFYEEWDVTSPEPAETLFIDWVVFNNFASSDNFYKFDGSQFLSFLGTQLEAKETIQRRALSTPLDFHFFVGGEDLYEYIRVSSAQSGITSLQVSPEYTNVVNGLGVFSSRYNKVKLDIDFSSASYDSLSCGRFTRKLNFLNRQCL